MTCPFGHAHITERRLEGIPSLVEQVCSTCLARWLVAHANVRAASERPDMGALVRTSARAQALLAMGANASRGEAVDPAGQWSSWLCDGGAQ